MGAERIATRGELVEGANKYSLSGVTIVPLGPEYAGKVLTLRVYSSVHGEIGPHTEGDPITIGSDHGVMVSILRRSLEVSLFALAACFLGFISLLISVRRFRRHKYMPFALGMCSFTIGVFYLTLPPLFSLVVESDAARYYTRLLSYAIFPVWLYLFVETVLEGHRVVRALWIAHAAYAILWLTIDLTGVGPRVFIQASYNRHVCDHPPRHARNRVPCRVHRSPRSAHSDHRHHDHGRSPVSMTS